MPVRHDPVDGTLDTLLRPRSVALVGASDSAYKVGGRPLHYMLEHRFAGRLFPVNPRGGTVQGLPCYRSLDELPEAPDAVILSVPGELAAEQIRACGRIGARNVILFSSGFAEIGPEGLRQQGDLLDAARRAGVRLLGPNTIGTANFACGAVLSFASIYQDFPPQDGPVAIVSQSGAVGASAYALLRESGIGVRYVCATGNQADIDVCDFMRAILADRSVRLLLVYMEEARDLASLEEVLALGRTRAVPILVLQGAQGRSGMRMAAHHTGAAGTRDQGLAELLDRYGCRRVGTLPQLSASAPLYLLASADRAPAPLRVGVISNSGASCVLAADACDAIGLPLAELSPPTVARLDALVPPFSRSRNPVDLTAMLLTDSGLLGCAVGEVLQDSSCDALALSLLAIAGASYDVPRFAADTARAVKTTGKPAVFSSPDGRVRQLFAAQGLPVFPSEQEALAALKDHADHRGAMAAPHPAPRAHTELSECMK